MDRRKFIVGGLAASAAYSIGAKETAAPAVPIPSDPNELAGKLRARALDIFAKNQVEAIEGFFHLPSAATYRSFFAWDSGWNIIALSRLDPESAYRELKTVFDMQAPDGHIPHEVRIPALQETDPTRKAVIRVVRRQYDDLGRSQFIDPPSFLIAADILYQRTADRRIFDLLPAMQRCLDYLTGPRDLFGDGLVSIIHPWESGTDSAPVFDAPLGININNPLCFLDYSRKYPALLNRSADLGWDLARIAEDNRFVFEDVGMNAVTAAGALAMHNLYKAAGRMEEAGDCRCRAKGMTAAMENVLWDEGHGYFYPRFDRGRPRQSRRTCLTGLTPLITGLVNPFKAERVLTQYLDNPEHFRGPWLVPFNSMKEVEGERIPFEQVMLWRGRCIWANMNWMAAKAAANYGRTDIARAITANFAKMVFQEGFREFYHPETGLGGGAPGFTWPALVVDMIEEYGI